MVLLAISAMLCSMALFVALIAVRAEIFAGHRLLRQISRTCKATLNWIRLSTRCRTLQPLYRQQIHSRYSRCNYELTLKNGDSQFSVDEEGLLEQTLAFFVFQCLLGCLAYNTFAKLDRKKKLHHTIRLFGSSVYLHMLGLLLQFISSKQLGDSVTETAKVLERLG